MTHLEPQYSKAFVPHTFKHSLEEIQKCCNWFVDAFSSAEIIDASKKLQVAFKSSGIGQDEHLFHTPLGALKVKFVKRLEGQYLGVAACFSSANAKGEDERFFTVYMNHQSSWVDSTGHEFNMDDETPYLIEAARLIQRALAALLQKQDKELAAI